MAEYLIQDTTLDAIADAINAKLDTSVAMTPAEMVTAIGTISGGGGGGHVEVTIVNGVDNERLISILNAITAGSGFIDWIAENISTAPESGSWLFYGTCLPSFSSNISITYRRTSTGNSGNGQWTSNGTVPSGTRFNVWEVVKNA